MFHIDVHSGLGPLGMDSLMVSATTNSGATLRRLVAAVKPVPEPYSIEGDAGVSADSASAGYELMRGDTIVGYGSLFNTSDRVGM